MERRTAICTRRDQLQEGWPYANRYQLKAGLCVEFPREDREGVASHQHKGLGKLSKKVLAKESNLSGTKRVKKRGTFQEPYKCVVEFPGGGAV